MIRINQLKMPAGHTKEELTLKIANTLTVPLQNIQTINIVKQSIDARKKDAILFIYSVEIALADEAEVLHRISNPNVLLAEKKTYQFSQTGTEALKNPPIIIGSGPAGLFCGLMLARNGYRPIIVERGEDVETRTQKVTSFWAGGALDTNSNVQFGEGGAGTFSDGKLNTLVKDPVLRNRKIMELFVEFGADSSILFLNKPHIGTDVLSKIVKNIRQEIIRLGGDVRFQSQVTDFLVENGVLTGVVINESQQLATENVVLAIGHSARDTFELLLKKGIPMQQKAFAVGLRIQHPQKMINQSQYGKPQSKNLGPADYKLTKQTSNGRGVYSFCMCPGGYVVNASSEENRLAINGMSNQDRGGKNANSALIVAVTPEDFPDTTPLAGVAYQRHLEELAYRYGSGKIPVQLYGDFKQKKESTSFGDIGPQFKGGYAFADLRKMLPSYISKSLIEGIDTFDHMIRGFGRPDAILAGIESRTSSPVRIDRDEHFESAVKGLFPCGEGAGYAGGITSAAMDGLKIAEELAARFAPL